MLYDLRTTARGGGAVRELRGQINAGMACGVFQTEVGTAGQAVIIMARDAQAVGPGRGPGGEGRGRLDPADAFGKNELEVLKGAPFMRPLEPQEIGRVWELRWYDFPAGTVNDALSAYERAMPHREEYYPVIGCWSVEVGPWQDRIYTLSPFKDWDHRDEIVAKLNADAAWPPQPAAPAVSGGAKILLPVAYSPLR